MNEIIKHINDTNASYRTPNAGDAKNTDLFLDNEHYELFKGAGEQVTVRFSKENLSKAILFIASILPRKYDNSAMHKSVSYSPEFVYDQLAFLDYFFKEGGVSVDRKTQTWNARKDVPKKNGEIDSRFYFNGLLEEVEYVNSKGEHVSSKFTIRNYLAGGYSNLHIKKADDGIFDVWVTNVQEPYFDEKEDGLEVLDNSTPKNLPLQQIFYGAPGTGKSFHVDEVCKKYKHYRTTFHPDSDYSTFVGCYKPVKENMKTATKDDVLDRDNLVARLKEYRNLYDETQAQTQFGYDYYESLRDRSDIGEILRDAAGKTFDTCIRVGMALAERNTPKTASSKITYDFVPQTFINAYIEAWRDLTKPVFLVIEEINRGNCAQIFGDLFQLLDRNEEGYSSYEIEPNTDLKNYIADQGLEISGVVDEDDNDISGKLMSGDLMALTPNLHIWATMNTSDQSLFPIDSAFKRRWDWKYMPINTEAKKGWSIKVNGVEYSWSSFLNKINSEIEDTTSSEDKQLGFFFCKADDTDEDGNNGVITAERFVSKVLFYLYNDVFKDYGFEREFFKDKENNNKLITFRSLFNMGGDINEERVELLLNNLEVEIVKNNIDEEDGSNRVSDTNAPYRVTFPDGVVICEDSGWETYIASLRKIGLDKALPFGEMYSRRNKTLPLITDKKIEDQGVYKYYEIDGYYVLSGTDSQHRLLNRINKDLNLGLTIE